MPGTEDMQREHIKMFAELEASAKSAHKRMDNLEAFKDVMYEMNSNIQVIAEQIKTITQTLVRHEDAIEDIQDKMETKEGMARIHQHMEDLQMQQDELKDRVAIEESKEAQAALEQIKILKRWLIGLVGAVITAGVLAFLGLR